MRVRKTADARREEILDAAQQLFITKGFQASTMEDILRAVGIAKGTLYHHFRSKEEILRQIVARFVRDYAERAQQIADGPAPAPERLLATLTAGRAAGADAELIDEFHAAGNAEFHVLSVVEVVRALAPIVARIIADGVAEQVFRTDQPREVAEIILVSAGVLLDEGFFVGDQAEQPRRLQGLIFATETLLGCPRGSLAQLAGQQ
ncbi:TetR/AcrR family transcriptional regulator [Buchananella hordeovulneris]|uniref:TetR/AcrR family transcriptional regulator n=1 Tax=Buchananella hordeovulneris TaxID=52770 RepID=UPI0026DC2158|nr:TetR/AcrR family transcriptional regulator [Buchananella hordeovulneris]MDO5080866.1 TetR/AcrR family transcriptional regulator [Buchananella hordeovulneris]